MPAADAPKRGAARRRPRTPAKPASRTKLARDQARQYTSQARWVQNEAQRKNRAQARAPSVHGHLGLGTSPKHIRTLNVKKHLEGVAHQQQAREQEHQYGRSLYKSSVKPKQAHRLISAAGIGGGLDKFLSGKTTAGAVRSLGDFVAKSAAAGPIASTIPGTGKFIGNAARDLVDIPTSFIPSSYDTIKHGVEAAKKGGLWAGVGAEAKLLSKPYQDLVEHPRKSVMEHPVGSLLLARGITGAIDRGAGMGLRAAPSQTLRDLGSTARPARDVGVPGTALFKEGRYAKGAITKAAQAIYDQKRPHSGVMSDSGYLHPHGEIGRQMNELASLNEDLRRQHRGEANKAYRKAMKGTKPSAATSLIAQNITHPTHGALVDYMEQLKLEREHLKTQPHSAAKLADNAKSIDAIQRSLKKFDHEDQYNAARRYADENLRLQAELEKHGILGKEQAGARLTPYAVQHMGAQMDRATGKLVDPHGVELSVEDIRAHMAHNGFKEPAFITQKPDGLGSSAFNVSREQVIGGAHRSGEATRQGTLSLDPDLMLQQNVKAQGLLDAHHGYQRFLGQFRVKSVGSRGLFKNKRLAEDAAREWHAAHPDMPAVRAVRATPFGATKSQADTLLHGDEAAFGEHVGTQLTNALKGEGDKGPWALVPEAAAKVFEDHLKSTHAPAWLTKVNSLWRTNVLVLKPRWLFGNVAEAAFRSLVTGSGPRSWYLGHQALKELQRTDPAMYEQAVSRMIGGGHYSLASRNSVHTPIERFQGKILGNTAKALHKFWEAPGPKQAADVWHGVTHVVFNVMNHGIESKGFQTAMLGKVLRQDPLMSKHFLKTSRAAVDEAARGLKSTPNQIRYGREVDRMYGKYGKFPPGLRRAIANYTPFIAWSLNALQFMYSVLPKDHPVLTSLIASSNIATEEWRKTHNLKVDPFAVGDGQIPGFLRGSIPTPDGGHLMASKPTPFGLGSAEGGVLGSLASTVIPQAQDIISNLQGKDWKDASLAGRGKTSSDVMNALAAVTSAIEGIVPGSAETTALTGAHLPNEAVGTKHPSKASERLWKYVTPISKVKAQKSKSTTGRGRKGKSGVQFGGKSSGGVHFGGRSSGGVKFGG